MVKRALTLLTSILIALPLLMPFNIFANSEVQIVPTWSQSAQQTQWANKFRVTNYCESSNNPQNYSCQLTITVNGDYYGYVYFDGYINNQIIFDYKTMFISGGIGTFYYTWYQNGLKEINKVNIAGLNLVTPTDDIDLDEIVDLLTSINQYEQSSNNILDSIASNTATTITEIRNVISQLIVSNGYLDTLTKLRQWSPYFESYPFIIYLLRNNFSTYTNTQFNYLNYPIFEINENDIVYKFSSSGNTSNPLYSTTFVMYVASNIYNINSLSSMFSVDHGEFTNFEQISYNSDGSLSWSLVKFDVTNFDGTYIVYLKYINSLKRYLIPIYVNTTSYYNLSTDFALRFGLRNKLLDDLNIIANGTTASQSAAQSSDSANSQLQTDSNTLFQQENGFKSDMNNAMQNVNTTFRLQDMGTKFVSSAQWVRSQYESLTNNTPFASLITFSLITGLALILLGKVYK